MSSLLSKSYDDIPEPFKSVNKTNNRMSNSDKLFIILVILIFIGDIN